LPNDVPPEIASAAFESIPRLYFLPFILFFLFSLAVLVGLYLRWKPIFYLFLTNVLLTFGSAIAGIALGLGLPSEGIFLNQRVGLLCSGGGVILALMMFLLVLQIEDDFFFDEKRILLRHDRDAAKGPDFLDSGHRYAGHDMWAMAAIHLRKAAALMPHQTDPHLALSAAYLNLKRYELAASALEEARRINPSDPQIEHLAVALTSRQAAESSPTANTHE
jgi:hypothetical protein